MDEPLYCLHAHVDVGRGENGAVLKLWESSCTWVSVYAGDWIVPNVICLIKYFVKLKKTNSNLILLRLVK